MITYEEFAKQYVNTYDVPTETAETILTTATIGSFNDFQTMIHSFGWPTVDDHGTNKPYHMSTEAILALELRYPFFIAHLENRCDSYLSVDDIPYGWLKTILLPLCEDIRDICIKHDPTGRLLCAYVLAQVKEKFGTLRWYDEFGFIDDESLDHLSHQILDDTYHVIQIAEAITTQVCIICGSSHNINLYGGWVHYECENCFNQRTMSLKPKLLKPNIRTKLIGEIKSLSWSRDSEKPIENDICATVMGKGFTHCLDIARELDKQLND